MYEAESMFEITNNEERLDSFKLFIIFSSLNIVSSASNYNINYCKKTVCSHTNEKSYRLIFNVSFPK